MYNNTQEILNPESLNNQQIIPVVPEALELPNSNVKFQGYDNYGFVKFADDSNNSFNVVPQSNENRPKFQQDSHISEDEAKEVFTKFVGDHCCYGKGPLDDLKLTDMISSNTYRYILETFTESRSTKHVYVPYRNEIIINYGMMPPPEPWSILVQPTALFQNEVKKVEIPNTVHIETCHKCVGVGYEVCYNCHGRGRRTCSSCSGSGRVHRDNQRVTCSSCSGFGNTRCFSCSGTGRKICSVCQGACRLKWYLELTVDFHNNIDDYIKKSESIPEELLRTCLAKNTFSEQSNRVFAITHHNDPDVNQGSYNLLNTHLNKFSQTRILQQRHEVNSIPVTLCKYNFKNKSYSFNVFGMDTKVYAPDYPRKCCCCSIL